MGGGSTTTNTTQSSIQQQQLPPWVNEAAQQNYAFAQDVANRPLVQYQGQLVPDVAPQMQQAWDLAAQSGGAGGPQYQGAEAGYLSALGKAPGQIATTNLAPYMNPYTESVINKTLPLMQQQLKLAQQGVGDQAVKARAFGGSRQGIMEGVTAAQGALGMGQMAADLNKANFTQAQAAAGQDVTAQQAKINSDILASGGLTALGQQAQANQARQFAELVTAGSLQQQQAQAAINAQQGKFNQAWNYPTQQMGYLLSALGMTPYGQTNVGYSQGTSTTEQSSDMAMSALGGLQALGGMFSGGGSAGGGLGGLLSGIFAGSDRRMKTDVRKVDTHPSGVPVYAYRYKGDPKSYPKVVGPMAEDIAKIAPQAVRPLGVGGRLGVDMRALDALAGGGPPGALSPPAPVGAVGALGSNLRPPKIRRPRPRPRPMMRGALAYAR